jgi:hypothetical protein
MRTADVVDEHRKAGLGAWSKRPSFSSNLRWSFKRFHLANVLGRAVKQQSHGIQQDTDIRKTK